MIRCSPLCALLVALMVQPAAAEADGPDAFRVVGVATNDALNLRASASAQSRIIARIPPDARGLRNLGCSGIPTFAQWQRLSPAERAAAGQARWCKVEYGGRTGWVAGRFLREDSGPGG